MVASKLENIGLTSLDDLFKTDAERQTEQGERVQIVPAGKVFPYARQPYSIDRPTPDLVRLMDSIERNGIAEPMIVRPREGDTYEIIAGHRRDYCAKAVGLETRPVIVREYTDEQADILVVDYNINREDLLPSEKARAYKLKLDAMKRQGVHHRRKRRNRPVPPRPRVLYRGGACRPGRLSICPAPAVRAARSSALISPAPTAASPSPASKLGRMWWRSWPVTADTSLTPRRRRPISAESRRALCSFISATRRKAPC